MWRIIWGEFKSERICQRNAKTVALPLKTQPKYVQVAVIWLSKRRPNLSCPKTKFWNLPNLFRKTLQRSRAFCGALRGVWHFLCLRFLVFPARLPGGTFGVLLKVSSLLQRTTSRVNSGCWIKAQATKLSWRIPGLQMMWLLNLNPSNEKRAVKLRRLILP